MAGRLRGVPWANLVGVVENGNRLVKAKSAAVGWVSGADTSTTLKLKGDCYVEFRAPNQVYAMCGLSSTGTSASYTDIQFAIYVEPITNVIKVYEDGSNVYTGGASSYATGDVLRVERLDGTIYYKRNGTSFYSHAITGSNATADLYVDCSIYGAEHEITDYKCWSEDADPTWIAEAKKPGARLNPLLKITFPSGNYWYTTEGQPIAVPAYGTPFTSVTDWGELTYASGDRDYSLQVTEWSVTINDSDRRLAKVFGSGERCHNAPVVFKIASPNIGQIDTDQSGWKTEFSGNLVNWEAVGDFSYKLNFRSNDLALRSPVIRTTLSRQDYAGISQEAIGRVPPLVYGRHHSQGAVAEPKGMIPAPKLWNWTGSIAYFGGWLGIPSIQQVYKDGIAQSGGGWTANWYKNNGRMLKYFYVTADPGSSEWSVDMNGLEHEATATGEIIEDVFDIMKHVASNFILPSTQWTSGAWLAPDPAKIDLASFADAKLALGNKAGAIYISDQDTGYEVLHKLSRAAGVQLRITPEGKLGVVVQQNGEMATDLYDSPTIYQIDAGDIAPKWEDDAQAKRIVGSYLYSAKENRALASHEIYDPNIPAESVAKLDLQCAPAMALPPPTTLTGLKAWWRADYDPIAGSGIGIGQLDNYDAVNGPNLSQANPAQWPVLWQDAYGRSWISHDGTDNQLDSGIALSNFKNAGSVTALIALRVNTFANDAVIFSDSGSKFKLRTFSDSKIYASNDDGATDQVATPVLQPYVWYVICVRQTGGKLYIGVNDARLLQMSSVTTGNTSLLTGNFSVGGIGSNYCHFDWSELVIFADDQGEASRQLMDWMLARHVYRYPSSVDTAKETMSRHLNEHGRPNMRCTINLPPSVWHKEPGQIIKVQHPAGPSDTPGWGFAPWDARPFRIMSTSFRPGSFEKRALLQDVKYTSLGAWDTGSTSVIDTGQGDLARREGRAISRESRLIRASYDWTDVPGTSPSRYITVAPFTPVANESGILLVDERFNYLKRSSNALGVASIAPGSLNGTAVNSSAITDGENVIGTEDGQTFPKSFLFTAGTTHAADLYVRLPDTTGLFNADHVFSMILRNNTSATAADEVVWRLQRLVADTWYWNDSTGAWQAGAVWNSTGSVTAATVGRFDSKAIPAGSLNETFRVDVGLKSGGTGSRTAHVLWCGLNKSSIAIPGVVASDAGTAAQFVTVRPNRMFLPCRDGYGVSRVRGSIAMRAKFETQVGASSAVYLFNMHGIGTASFQVTYQTFTGNQVIFSAGPSGSVGSSTYTFGGAEAINKGDVVDMACSWTSALGELALVRGVQLLFRVNSGSWRYGNVATAGADVADLTGQKLEIGQPAGHAIRVSRFRSWPIPLSNAELQAWLG